MYIFIDGASKGNPGPAGAGIFIVDQINRTELTRLAIPIGRCTNNVAEHTALVQALEKAKDLRAKEITIFSDSKLLVEQMKGNYKVKDSKIAELVYKSFELLSKFDKYSFVHISRKENKIADTLASFGATISSTQTRRKIKKRK